MTRVLILRAIEDALRTEELLNTLGVFSVISPVLEIVATGAAIPAGHYDAVLASSAKGVALARNVEAFKLLPFHAVGAKTARGAEAAGWRVDIVAGNAEAILPLLRARYATSAHFLYLAGRARQAALETGLADAGHQITAVDVYEAMASAALTQEARAAIAAGQIDGALHYSRRSAEIFLQLARAAGLDGALPSINHFALSEDVAAPLRAAGLETTVAARPEQEHLLALLKAI